MMRSANSRKGQALVETALVLVLVLTLLGAIIEFGQIYHAYLTVSYSALQGTRAATLGKTDSEITTIVLDSCQSLDQTKITVFIDPADGGRTTGVKVKVKVSYSYDSVFPIIGLILPHPLVLQDQAMMRVE